MWKLAPWVCSVHITIILWALSDLLEQNILVNKVYDEQSLRQGKQSQIA